MDPSQIVSAELILTAAIPAAVQGENGKKSLDADVPPASAFSLSPTYVSWSEGGATWNCAQNTGSNRNKIDCASSTWPSIPAGVPLVSATPTADGISFDVTDDVHKLFAGDLPDYGWMITMEGKKPLPLAGFASREASSSPPQLVVTYRAQP